MIKSILTVLAIVTVIAFLFGIWSCMAMAQKADDAMENRNDG